MSKHQQITDEKFHECYLIMAKIVTETGDKYLPIFKRMHEEKLLREANAELKGMARIAIGELSV